MASIALAVLGACAAVRPAELERREYTDRAMGTGVRIVLYAADAEDGARAARAAFARIAELERCLSSWSETSELSELVRTGGPAAVSPDLARNLELALHYARRSEGVLDPTIAPLVDLWRESRQEGALPSEAQLANARAFVGHERVDLVSHRTYAVAELQPGTRLDLGATAKGDACDEALATLTAHGITRALVEVGGDLALGAAPPGADGWRVGVPGGETLVLSHCGVAGSGATEQFAVIDGVRYAHLVDPRTGLGSTTAATVTVVARSAAVADALASIASLTGPAEAPALLARIEPGAVAHW